MVNVIKDAKKLWPIIIAAAIISLVSALIILTATFVVIGDVSNLIPFEILLAASGATLVSVVTSAFVVNALIILIGYYIATTTPLPSGKKPLSKIFFILLYGKISFALVIAFWVQAAFPSDIISGTFGISELIQIVIRSSIGAGVTAFLVNFIFKNKLLGLRYPSI